MPKRLTYSYVKKFIESDNCVLMSDSYNNNSTKLLVKCPKGHEYEVMFSNFQMGKGCPECNFIKLRNDRKLPYNFIKKYIQKHGYDLLSKKYNNNSTKLLLKCPKGHEYEASFGTFQQGSRCPVCWFESSSSKGEKELSQFISTLDIDIVENDRTQIINPLTGYNLELDVWIPSLNKAIEYNGEYWHNKPYQKIKDHIKVGECNKKGIDLLVITDNEWINTNKECKNNLCKFLRG